MHNRLGLVRFYLLFHWFDLKSYAAFFVESPNFIFDVSDEVLAGQTRNGKMYSGQKFSTDHIMPMSKAQMQQRVGRRVQSVRRNQSRTNW